MLKKSCVTLKYLSNPGKEKETYLQTFVFHTRVHMLFSISSVVNIDNIGILNLVWLTSTETQGQIAGARETLSGRENMAPRKVKNGEKSPWGQYLTRPVPKRRRRSAFWLDRKTQKVRKNWGAPNKYEISSWDRIVIFHWENQGNLW